MKSVLITIKPYYVFLIIAHKMGWNIPREKTIEVRKDFPKNNAWNRVVHIYCGKDKKSFTRIPKQYQPLMEKLSGKVVGEFVCDQIEDFSKWESDYAALLRHICLYAGTNYCDLDKYLRGEKKGYGWHISSLNVYDEPKALDGFYQKLPQKILDSGNYDCRKEWNVVCMDYPEGGDYCEECPFGGRVCLKRPPQSWLYVDGFKIPIKEYEK